MKFQRSVLTFLATNVVALVVVFALVTSCKKDDTTPDTTPPNNGLTSIQGTWKVTSLSVNPAFVYAPLSLTVTEVVGPLGLLEAGCISNVTITFNANGTIANNVASQAACANATISKQLLSSFFSTSTTYAEANNKITLTTSGQNVVADRTYTTNTATLITTLSVKPDNTPGQTTYTMLLTKQ